MKKYNTKPVDYTGCHPVIAEHLKQGEAIECFVHDSPARGHMRYWVVAYLRGQTYPYKTTGEAFRYAGPIPIKVKRIMPPERAIPALIAGGWFFMSNGVMCGPVGTISHEMFRLMGHPLDDHCVGDWSWPACIIEEVSEDE